MKNIFTTVYNHLNSLGGVRLEGNALKRVKLLSGLITGIINKGNSSLPDIGSGIPQNIDANSKAIAAQRFVSNKWIDVQTHYLPYILPFIKGLIALTIPRQGIRLIIDGSQMGKHNATLMISIVYQNRAIPLCWFTKQGSKGHFKQEDHLALVQQAHAILAPILPEQMAVTLLGDGEFDGVQLQQLCKHFRWFYVFRTASDSVFYEQDFQERFQARDIAPAKQQSTFFMPHVLFTEERFDYVNFLVWHNRKKYKDPLFLISNIEEALDIIHEYKYRFSIERLFKDLKSNSFNLHKTRLQDPLDVSRLLIIAALAFLLLVILGLKYDTQELHKKVHRLRPDRVVCSLFSFAYKLIKYFTDYDIPFNFFFQFSKNNSEFSSA